MAEAVGLALGVAALYSACVDVFDVVVSAKDCSKEHEELSALLGLQRLRFEFWGESVGLPSGRFDHEPTIPYNTHLDLPQVRPDVERALENIRQLLDSVAAIDGKYGVTPGMVSDEGLTTLRGTRIFQKSFERLKSRVRKGQKQKSTRRTTIWALRDATKFKDTITRLTAFLDGLHQVTTSLGLVQQRFEALRVHEAINTITNEEDLDLLIEAASHHSSSSIHRTVSDAASKRLSMVTVSMVDAERATHPRSNASTYSFYTAKTKPSEHVLETLDEMDIDDSVSDKIMNTRSCAECEDSMIPCSTAEGTKACSNCIETHKQCSFDLDGTVSFGSDMDTSDDLSTPASSRFTPQHERWLAETIARSRSAPRLLSFKTGDANHGDAVSEINDSDLYYWIDNGPKLVVQAHNSTSVAKRMFHELKLIRKAHVPFVSATPVADDLGRILASIEGPPDTAYEGGIFWILVTASQKNPPGAPTLRFHTKIYHPNIDPRTGVLCADYEQKWSPSKVPPSLRGHFAESTALWSQRTSPDMWSLLALLVAICGLLASPNVQDPLVPEIAQKYVEDPEGFYEAAKMWTQRYASSPNKPDEESLRFLDGDGISGPAGSESSSEMVHMDCDSEVRNNPAPIQEYWRWKYADKVITNSVEFPASSSSSRDRVQSETSTDSERLLKTIEDIVDSFLHYDAQQNCRLRQAIGDRLSDIEQWRMVRELRLELEKGLFRRDPNMPLTIISSPRPMAESDIRIQIAGRVPFIKQENNPQYFTYVGLLKRSFNEKRKHASWRHTKTSSKSGKPRSSSVQRASWGSSVNGNRASCSALRWQKKRKVSSSTTRYVSVELHKADNKDKEGYYDFSSDDTTDTKHKGGYYNFSSDDTTDTIHKGGYYDCSSDDMTDTEAITEPKSIVQSYHYRPNYQYSSRHPRLQQNPYRHGASSGDYSHQYGEYYTNPKSDYRTHLPYSRSPTPPTYGSAAHVHREDPEYDFVMHNGKVRQKPKQVEEASYEATPRRRRNSSSTPPPRPKSKKAIAPPPKVVATEADVRRHRIPLGYSIRNWDPSEEPIMLLGSVFDANSLGKWIYDWTVYHHGPATPITDMAGELWLLLLQLAGKVKRAEECMPRIHAIENREMVDDFIESGERLMERLKRLLKSCETPMLKAGKKSGKDSAQLDENAGTEFVDTIFGQDRQLEATEKFMSSTRLWNLRFDANCEDILRRSGQGPSYSKGSHSEDKGPSYEKDNAIEDAIVLLPVAIRTAFGLEDIPE
ncbi:uncharacterized protein PAC_09386 [Phialocephala subalpina]|uniref:UBC core domain-containing protein n=1 Tax=Phialocephala subalpina TaxID=576137 RepID=A0A1L7X394_9HELO|nr:uncharacterized protein PAC_09386 [Phialocephala subalpina]